jgi:hypothetical protein
LCDVEPRSRTRRAAFFEHCMKDKKQIQIDDRFTLMMTS